MLGTDTTPPYEYVWNISAVREGGLWVSANIVDKAGNNSGLIWDPDWVFFTIDHTPPTSAVLSLPETVTDEQFTVRWSGTDNYTPSDLIFYDVQYQLDCTGDWLDWFVMGNLPGASFNGQDGHSYCFRSRAYDLPGNTEAWSEQSDARTQISTAPTPTFTPTLTPATPQPITETPTLTPTLTPTPTPTLTPTPTTVPAPPATPKLQNPAPGSVLDEEQIVTLQWDNPAHAINFTVELFRNGGEFVNKQVKVSDTVWLIGKLSPAEYLVRIQAYNSLGKWSEWGDYRFTVRAHTQQPTLTPQPGATATPVPPTLTPTPVPIISPTRDTGPNDVERIYLPVIQN